MTDPANLARSPEWDYVYVSPAPDDAPPDVRAGHERMALTATVGICFCGAQLAVKLVGDEMFDPDLALRRALSDVRCECCGEPRLFEVATRHTVDGPVAQFQVVTEHPPDCPANHTTLRLAYARWHGTEDPLGEFYVACAEYVRAASDVSDERFISLAAVDLAQLDSGHPKFALARDSLLDVLNFAPSEMSLGDFVELVDIGLSRTVARTTVRWSEPESAAFADTREFTAVIRGETYELTTRR